MANDRLLKVAEQAATAVLQRHKVKEPPVDVEALAAAEGITVTYDALEESVSGLLVRDSSGNETAGINALHHPNRQRFTIAHEIGHHLLHPNRPEVVVDEMMFYFRGEPRDKGTPEYVREMQANAFAAALLMPKKFLLAEAARREFSALDEPAMRSLANRFGVSTQALNFRLQNLGMLQGM
ncbi:MAG: ImmA/IrrE family metallo-endopeptidase [Planctomycetes bacterium]|nr:ImmA/IrrE family metallo-endopeptidase [Planctomycetota bacterium]